LGLVIISVDLATTANLFEFYSFFEHPLFAALVALAFAALQVGTLILFAMPLPPATRRPDPAGRRSPALVVLG